jgi:hypothetical protein
MRHITLFNTQYRVLLISSLMSSCLLMGCASNFHFERFYKPAATPEGAAAVTLQPRATPPQLAYSHDPDRDGGFLRQHGYVLIGTTSFNGAQDLPYADHAVAQGQKLGAAVVLLMVRSYSYVGDSRDFASEGGGGASYFASYWAKPDPANTSRSN